MIKTEKQNPWQFEGCLLCRQGEGGMRGPDRDVDYICSRCIQRMLGIPHREIIERYGQAFQKGEARTIYALASFVPAKIRHKIQAGIAYVVTPAGRSGILVQD